MVRWALACRRGEHAPDEVIADLRARNARIEPPVAMAAIRQSIPGRRFIERRAAARILKELSLSP